jgi:hypothetical protein
MREGVEDDEEEEREEGRWLGWKGKTGPGSNSLQRHENASVG